MVFILTASKIRGRKMMRKFAVLLVVLLMTMVVGVAWAADTIVVPPTENATVSVTGGEVTGVTPLTSDDKAAAGGNFAGRAEGANVDVRLKAGAGKAEFSVRGNPLVMLKNKNNNFDFATPARRTSSAEPKGSTEADQRGDAENTVSVYEVLDNGNYDHNPAIGQVKFSYVAGTPNTGSSGGGCAAMSLGAFALLFAPMAVIASRKK